MNQVKISVIIPVYNVERFLEKCLDSILYQTFKDFEVICIDDGSTDNSLSILKSYKKKDKRIKIYTQNNRGAGVARNFGLKKAQGKYIQFLDSDDYFDKKLLEKLFNLAEKNNADLVICSSRKVDDFGNIIESQNPNMPINLNKAPLNKVFNKFDYKEDIFSLFTPIPWNKLILKDLIINNSIEFPDLKIYEDIAFAHSLVVCAEKIIAINEELINYRFNRAGSHANIRSKNTIEMVKSCLKLKEFLQEKGIFQEFEKAFNKAFINHIRSEISFCHEEEYQKFLSEFKNLLPNEWEKYQNGLRKNHITIEYLNKIIGNRPVLFYGASLFIRKILEQETIKNPNILGIIDKNTALWNKTCGNYQIYSPEKIKELKPEGILLTILSNNEDIYLNLKEELSENFPDIELLQNIFDEENN